MLNAILVGLATFTLLGLTGVLFLPKFIRHQLEQQLKQATSRLFTESYTKNIFEGVTALRKFGIQWAVENELRSHHPAALLKPIGTHRPFPHFDGLLFSSARLHRRGIERFNDQRHGLRRRIEQTVCKGDCKRNRFGGDRLQHRTGAGSARVS